VTVLSDVDILRYIAEGKLAIRDYRQTSLTPNGYDLSIEEIRIPATGITAKEGTVTVPPLNRFLISTVERVEFGAEVAGELWLRTTWARRGVLASFGKIDAGFRGTLTLAAFNASHEPLPISIGERFAQLVFIPLSTAAAKTYGERSGNYQDQQGVVVR